MSDLVYAPLTELSRRIRTRALSPVALVEACLDRIERCRALNAFITVTAEVARAQAGEAEREIAAGRYRGPLHGIPVSLKDLIDTKGIRSTCGSRMLADRVPSEDAAVAARLHAAGAVLLGKNNLHEFAFGVTTDNPHFGPTRNPWRLDRIPGGSSGGSGAAVAAGCGPVSIGTERGGARMRFAPVEDVTHRLALVGGKRGDVHKRRDLLVVRRRDDRAGVGVSRHHDGLPSTSPNCSIIRAVIST